MFNSLDEALLCLAEGDYVIDITDDNLSPESREIYFMLRFFTDYLDKTDEDSLINTVKYPFVDWLDEEEFAFSEIFVDSDLIPIENPDNINLDTYFTPHGSMAFGIYRKFILHKEAVFNFFCNMYRVRDNKIKELLIKFNFSKHINKIFLKSLDENKTKKTKKVNLESDIVTKLISREKLKCKREVSTPTGRIDILTDSELIEVKEYSNYKSAIGQLICYGNSYPEHKLRLHLFNVKEKSVDHIKVICDNLDIKFTYE
jgi:hypothetical protein